MSARIAGYILILQSEKNHDSVERLNLADRITEVEKANNLYLDLDYTAWYCERTERSFYENTKEC